MNPALFGIVASLCAHDYSSVMCIKTNEAFLKQEGYWNFAEKLGSYAANIIGKTESIILGTAVVLAKEKKINLTFGPDKCYALRASQEGGLVTVTWRME